MTMRLAVAAVLCALASGQPRAIVSKCLACHGDPAASGLDLRTRESALKGGKRGPALKPGGASTSLLARAVRREGPLQMPPGKPLAAPEIQEIVDWIDQGAPYAAWWSFQKPIRPSPPPGEPNPIDAFVRARLSREGVAPAPEADRRTLARRAHFDLHGLPPTPDQVDQFAADPSPDAYRALVDRLLDSPRYGERWGRYWLDLVRYADTSGFETDHFFVNAWRYRDYVVQSLNRDKPYDVFLKEQVAADEIWSTSTDLEGTLKLSRGKEENLNRRIGTGLFTIGSFPIEYTYYGDQFRAEWQADAIDTIGSAMLGLTLGCARCHDHKFDPITQRDYYRMAALFSGSVEREIPLGSLFDVQTATRGFPLQAHLEALRQMARGGRRDEMLQRLGEAYLRAPQRMPTANVLAHEESVPDTHILHKGDFRAKGERVEPGFPASLNPGPPIVEPKDVLFVPRRRKALAEWLASPDNPLVARVMVNRIWQGHFGDGIVRTPNDFGRQGEPPSHPELLDWLAVEFRERGWSIKQMHRLIMMSATYRASSVADPAAMRRDPDNRLFGRMARRRLDGDAIRDSILAVAGTINLRMGGVGVIPPLSKEEIQAARMPNLWPTNPNPAEHDRRSIYLQMKRSMTLPMLQVFDAPDTAASCARRERSTVAPQALALMNGDFAVGQARRFAESVAKQAQGDAARVEAAWRRALGRSPDDAERTMALDYLGRAGLERLCLMLFNLNEFVYVD